ncbi:unnamed protein product [Prunus armeniaca]|uniref:Uncharacterized protein n=1 Tax=Prunus armeniaca TaxID=36596 RepID=A0A6J5X6T7_PRUAR|nr:unnamed protein product [Prunus armeniaca]CAB4307622.1 unnamed protein product [Prunus armeniaca]
MAHHHLHHSLHLPWLLQLLRQFNESWLLFEAPQSWSPWSLPSDLKADTVRYSDSQTETQASSSLTHMYDQSSAFGDQ